MNRLAFFQKLFPEDSPGLIELRQISPEREVIYRGFYIDALAASEAIDRLSARKDVGDIYFGVLKRLEPSSNKVSKAICCWVDIDWKNVENYSKVLFGMLYGDIRPTIAVDTGHGVHGYFILDHLSDDLLAIEELNFALAQKFGGDAVHDRERVLRVPGTMNVKDPARPKLCRVIHEDGPVWSIEELRKRLPEVNYQTTKVNVENFSNWGTVPVDESELAERVGPLYFGLIRLGLTVDLKGRYWNDRDRLIFAVVNRMIDCGYDREEIYSVMIDPKYEISSKYYDKKRDGNRYIKNTIERAFQRREDDVC